MLNGHHIDTIIYGRHFTCHLALFKWSLNDGIDPLYDKKLDWFCYHILPKIYDNIKWLSLEILSVECFLHAATYPNLYRLSLNNININTHARLFYSKKFDLVFI